MAVAAVVTVTSVGTWVVMNGDGPAPAATATMATGLGAGEPTIITASPLSTATGGVTPTSPFGTAGPGPQGPGDSALVNALATPPSGTSPTASATGPAGPARSDGARPAAVQAPATDPAGERQVSVPAPEEKTAEAGATVEADAATTAGKAPKPGKTTKRNEAAKKNSAKDKVISSGRCGASFYDEGQMTASGERFDPGAMTAAHKTLPMGSKVRVTNPGNGKTVTVRINDRGPYVSGRCLDLSRAAFDAIGNLSAGTMSVKYEVLAR